MTTQAPPIPADPTSLRCSFCDKSAAEVKKLIAGPSVYICDECISLCNEIIDEENWTQAQRSPEALYRYVDEMRDTQKAFSERFATALKALHGTIWTGNFTRH